MDGRIALGLIPLFVLCLTKGAAGVCQRPSINAPLARENLQGDIVMTIVSQASDDEDVWSVEGSMDTDQALSDLAHSFSMIRTKPFWNLVVTRGIVKPESKQKDVMFDVKLKIGCTDRKHGRMSLYPVSVTVISEKLMEKVPITVPENTPVGHAIYFDKDRKNDEIVEYRLKTLSDQDTASDVFNLDKKTGFVYLMKPLDYESDLKVSWLLVTKKTAKGTKLRLFRIEVGNVNDNAPQFYTNGKCQDSPHCRVVKYNFTLDKTGNLRAKNGNFLRAVDPDGDSIVYNIVNAIPEQNFITLNKLTGELSANRPASGLARHYLLTIKASDGHHEATVTVAVEVEKIEPIDVIMEKLGIGLDDKGVPDLEPPKLDSNAWTPPIPMKTQGIVKTTSTPSPDMVILNEILPSTRDYSGFLKNLLNKGPRQSSLGWANVINNTTMSSLSEVHMSVSNTTNVNGSDFLIAGDNATLGNITEYGESEDPYLVELCFNLTLIQQGWDRNTSLLSRNESQIDFEDANKLCTEMSMKVVGPQWQPSYLSGASCSVINYWMILFTSCLGFALCSQTQL